LIGADGRVVWVLDETIAVRDEEYHPIMLQGFLIDITERVEREGALHQSEELNRFVAASSRELIAVFGLGGTIDYLSASITSLLGYQPSELVGRNWSELVHPDDLPAAQADFELRAAGVESPASPTRTRHKDGSWVALEGTLSVLEDAQGDPTRFVAVCRPVQQAVVRPVAA